MDDDDKPRRNLMVISILFITYSLAGGSIDDHITYMKLARPAVLEYIAFVMFVYFYWAFWVTHKGRVANFLQNVTLRMRAYPKQLIPLIETALKPSVPQNETDQLAFIQLIQRFHQGPHDIPLPQKTHGEILEWNATYNGELKVSIREAIFSSFLKLSGTIQSDALILLWLKALFVESYTTSSFKDIILPYALALIAISITVIRFLIC